MSNSCLSCGMPLVGQNVSSHYCEYCSNEDGTLKSREEVQQGIAGWLAGWCPEPQDVDFMQRANNYMKAMPAWAQK